MTPTQRAAIEQALEALSDFDYDKRLAAITALRAALAETAEPFGHVTVRRLSQRFENHVDQYQFYPAGERPYLDNVDECHAVYTAPQPPAPAVELTDMEIAGLWVDILSATHKSGIHEDGIIPHRFARAAIAAHEAKKGGA